MDEDPYEYVGFCYRCFTPLRRCMVAATYHAHYIQWESRTEGDITLHSCESCLRGLDETIAKGMRALVKEWEEANIIVLHPVEGENVAHPVQ